MLPCWPSFAAYRTFRQGLLDGGRVVRQVAFTNVTTFTNWCYNGRYEARYGDYPR